MSAKPRTSGATHPLWLLVSHWLNALAVFVLALSGWRIYDASPVFSSIFIPPQFTLGGWLAGALNWHFAAMWLLFFNGLFYLGMSFATGRFRAKFFPLSFRELWRDIGQTLRLKLAHDDLAHYNMIQKLFYLAAILSLVMMVLSGLVLWKSVQFPLLRWLFGGYDTARQVHFIFMAVLAAFTAVHVFMAMLVPRTIKGMLLGKA